MKAAGFNVTHVYGLTEVYGPAVVNDWHDGMGRAAAMASTRPRRRARACATRARGPRRDGPGHDDARPRRRRDDGRGDVPRQHRDEGLPEEPEATEEAFAGGWFHSGDLGVMHPDGYIQLKDRSKDIIISGGENISSIEVEDALYKHPAVQAAAVVAKPDEKWGETPCAFVELKPGGDGDGRGNRSPGAARTSPTTRARATWCSPNCPRPRPARSRNSSCARWRGSFRARPRGRAAFEKPSAQRMTTTSVPTPTRSNRSTMSWLYMRMQP